MTLLSAKVGKQVVKTDRIQLTYRLKFTTPFHCGTGLRSGFIDYPVVRDARDNVYVPGSTFKGVVREHCEQLSRFYTLRDDDEIHQRIASLHNERQALLSIQGPSTMVTRIFGSRYQPGQLFFDDARQPEEEVWQSDSEEQSSHRSIQTDSGMRTRLDRPAQTTVPGVLRVSEFGLKDLVLYGSICGWLTCTALANIEGEPSYSLLLLLAGLCMLTQLGGSRSAGKGQCVCEITQLSVNSREVSSATWLSWLDHLDVLLLYSKDAAQEEGE